MTDEGVNLSIQQAQALAHRVILERLEPADWLDWEDYPALGEYAFDRLVESVSYRLAEMWRELKDWERALDVDTVELTDRAVGATQ